MENSKEGVLAELEANERLKRGDDASQVAIPFFGIKVSESQIQFVEKRDP